MRRRRPGHGIEAVGWQKRRAEEAYDKPLAGARFRSFPGKAHGLGQRLECHAVPGCTPSVAPNRTAPGKRPTTFRSIVHLQAVLGRAHEASPEEAVEESGPRALKHVRSHSTLPGHRGKIRPSCPPHFVNPILGSHFSICVCLATSHR